MDAGKLNARIEVLRQSTDTNGWKEQEPEWEPLIQVWASIRHVSGLQSIKADANTSVVKASIRIRFRPGVVAGMRVRHGGTSYAIRAVLPDQQHRQFIDLVCEVI